MKIESTSPTSCLVIFLLSLSFLFYSSSFHQTQTPPTTKDICLDDPVIHFTPGFLGGYSAKSVSCERVRVVGVSRLNINKYANSFRVTMTPSGAIPERLHSQIEVCFHRNASLGLCKCAKEEWRSIKKGQWSAFMSPYEDRYVDVKFVGGTSGPITVSVEEVFQQWRLYWLVFGILSMLFAPILSDWVPFYYSSSMAVGVLLVVLFLLFQSMKLLPTGRKGAFYYAISTSLLGLGSYLVHYFSMLINSILVNFGLSEDMYNPVSVFVGVGIVLAGAALGYWIVRKYIISEDGSVDDGISYFVKWAVRIVGLTSILLSTLDTPLAILALASCWGICSFINSMFRGSALVYWSNEMSRIRSPWLRAKQVSAVRKNAEFLSRSAGKYSGMTPRSSPKSTIPWIKGTPFLFIFLSPFSTRVMHIDLLYLFTPIKGVTLTPTGTTTSPFITLQTQEVLKEGMGGLHEGVNKGVFV
ncbi:hypothetical protein IFM89_003464 [Coptis chinensis]|uniref:Uncharacterized protein n=1 Tax=Coptis chinensis TaxID=261450 RepID=A0A835HCC3_9MAGN|nr:hypothetical protein IFM89_003464 [Coptis chinensis]